jgi:hypothetical protein
MLFEAPVFRMRPASLLNQDKSKLAVLMHLLLPGALDRACAELGAAEGVDATQDVALSRDSNQSAVAHN